MKSMSFALVTAMSLLVLAACGSGDTQNTQTSAPVGQTATISLTASNARSEKTGIGPPNILDLCAASWPTWSGEPTGIRCARPDDVDSGGFFSPHGVLFVPAPTNGNELTVGVRRYDEPLQEGFSYRFTADGNGGAAAVLFLFGHSGELIPVPGADGLALVRSGEAITFDAPANVVGFFLQVQSAWNATAAGFVSPYIPQPTLAGGLLDVQKPWTDWAGNPVSEISYNGLVGHTFVGAPEQGESLRYGIQRYNIALAEGNAYELGIRAARANGWLLLFMFDSDGQLIPYQPGEPWALVKGRNDGSVASTSIIAPAGVASFAVQIQSEFNASENALLYPRFERTDSVASR